MKITTLILSSLMKSFGIDVETLNGDQDQQARIEIIDGFIKNKYNVLITTDVGSRGLDVCDVDFVINYDLPQNNKDYVHRVGRTARAGKKGVALTLVTQYDVSIFQKIEYFLNRKLNLFTFNENYHQFEEIIDTKLLKVKEEVKLNKTEKKKFRPKKYKKN